MPIMHAKAISKHIIIMGNINIDMSDDVDQALIGRTTKALPIYQEVMEDDGLIILNKEKTRYAKTRSHHSLTTSPPTWSIKLTTSQLINNQYQTTA